jgi:hypothetical protein
MKIHLYLGCAAALALCLGAFQNAFAGMAGTGNRDAAFYAANLSSWSVGLDGSVTEREFKDKRGSVVIPNTRSGTFYLGYDVVPAWLTLFGTAGTSEMKYKGSGSFGKGNFLWSGGLQANFWRTDIADPEFMAGTLMLKGVAEYTKYHFDGSDYGNKPEWSDTYFALPFSYELFVTKEEELGQTPYSLTMSIGPAISLINGSSIDGREYSEKNNIGVMGGADIYMAHNLSLGFHVQYFDHVAMGGDMIYHF